MTDNFTNIFGGSTVQPSEVRYRAIALTANVSLFWPSEKIDTNSVIALWNTVTPSGPGFSITFPPATTIGAGQDALFMNKGSDAFDILANDATTIATVQPGVAMYIINADNSTVAGSWQLIIFGGTASQVNAAALAGDGLIARAGQLNLNLPIIAISANYVSTFADLANVLNWTGGAGTITLESPAVAGQGWFAEIRNSGSGSVVVSPPSGLIDGAASKTYAQTESSLIHTDGVNYYTVGYGRAVVSSFTRLVISVAGSANVTLTSAQAQNQMLEFTGALTGDISVSVPNTVAEYFVYNNTTGAHTLTFKTVAGTGAIVIQGQRRIAVCDGTNIVFADTLGTGTVTQVNSGTGLSGGPITSTGTLNLSNTGVTPGSYTLLAATVNSQGQLTAASSGSLDIIGNVQGDILYRNATVWTVLAPGTAGQVLETGGAAANPSWNTKFGAIVRVFGTPGSTFYTPSVGTVTVDSYIYGGAGGGGGALATGPGQVSAGSGGAAGEVRAAFNIPIATVTGSVIAVGIGGIGVSGGTGATGGSSSFGSVVAIGGTGGSAGPVSGTPVTGFVGVPAMTVGTGGTLSSGTLVPEPGLYLGGVVRGGNGASSAWGSGGRGAEVTGNGGVAGGFGAGGGGAANSASSGARPGGNGFAGLVIIVEHS